MPLIDHRHHRDFLGPFALPLGRLPSNVTWVQSKADLPAPSTGVITLAAGMTYWVTGFFDLGTDRIEWSAGAQFEGIVPGAGFLYTGSSDPMLTIEVEGAQAIGMKFESSNDDVLLADGGTTDAQLLFIRCHLTNGDNGSAGTLGILNSVTEAAFLTCRFDESGDGWTVSGAAGGDIIFDTCRFGVLAGVYIDLDVSVVNRFFVSTCDIRMIGGNTFLVGDSGGANINVAGRLMDNTFSDAGTTLVGVTPCTTNWTFDGNSPRNSVRDTRAEILAANTGATTPTVITAAGVSVLVAEPLSVVESCRFTLTAPGRLTYVGAHTIECTVHAQYSLQPVTGGATRQLLTISLHKNGSGTKLVLQNATAVTSEPDLVTFVWRLSLAPNDFLEIFASNTFFTNNINVPNSQFFIQEV